MALTESNMLPLGTQAPDFVLLDVVSKEEKSLLLLKGKNGTLIVFSCNHCPYVIHLLDAFLIKVKQWNPLGINTIVISSNSIESHPQDGPAEMAVLAREKSFDFPYLFDETQEVAHAYDAACTPDFYLFDSALKLNYRGRFDASRPGNDNPLNGEDLQAAVDALLHKKTPLTEQWPGMGCNIKWHPGNEPTNWNV